MKLAWVKVACVGDVGVGSVRSVSANGLELALYRTGNGFFATQNACLHRGGSLGMGALSGQTIVCPLHGWEFDVSTGACLTSPGQSLKRYETKVEGDDVLVDV